MGVADVRTLIAEFVADPSQTTLVLPQMTTGQRKSAKKLLDQHAELWCKDEGTGWERRLHVYKVMDQEYAKNFMAGWEDDVPFFTDPVADETPHCTAAATCFEKLSINSILAYRDVLLATEAPGLPRVNSLGYKASWPYEIHEPEAAATAKNPMDELLKQCFLQAAKTNQITKQLRLGMPSKGSRIYAECMKPCRQIGTSIDVKTSSFRGVRPFFEHLEEQGLVDLKPGLPDPVVTNFHWNHTDIVNFNAWPLETTVVGSAGDSAQAVKSKMASSSEVTPPSRGKSSQSCRSIASMSQWPQKDANAPERVKDPSREAMDIINRVPSPSKARARRQH